MGRLIEFRCGSQSTPGLDYRIRVDADLGTATCACRDHTPGFCSHVDATLVAGERHMVVEQDRDRAAKAFAAIASRIKPPAEWVGSWRRNKRWRGLFHLIRPGGAGGMDWIEDQKARYGDDYHSRPKVCFTGKGHLSRSELIEEARQRGFRAVDSFQRDLLVLVAEDPTRDVAKLKGARSAGVAIISYQEWKSFDSDGVLT